MSYSLSTGYYQRPDDLGYPNMIESQYENNDRKLSLFENTDSLLIDSVYLVTNERAMINIPSRELKS